MSVYAITLVYSDGHEETVRHECEGEPPEILLRAPLFTADFAEGDCPKVAALLRFKKDCHLGGNAWLYTHEPRSQLTVENVLAAGGGMIRLPTEEEWKPVAEAGARAPADAIDADLIAEYSQRRRATNAPESPRDVFAALLEEALRSNALGVVGPEGRIADSDVRAEWLARFDAARQPTDWSNERSSALARLREAGEAAGDNDWPDDLHLGDAIEKHLNLHAPGLAVFNMQADSPPRVGDQLRFISGPGVGSWVVTRAHIEPRGRTWDADVDVEPLP
jgi:hypothetical protein